MVGTKHFLTFRETENKFLRRCDGFRKISLPFCERLTTSIIRPRALFSQNIFDEKTKLPRKFSLKLNRKTFAKPLRYKPPTFTITDTGIN
jgi:hypothetical protein